MKKPIAKKPKATEKQIFDIIKWIMDHKDDEKAMDTLSNIVFPLTSKYKSRYGNYNRGSSEIPLDDSHDDLG